MSVRLVYLTAVLIGEGGDGGVQSVGSSGEPSVFFPDSKACFFVIPSSLGSCRRWCGCKVVPKTTMSWVMEVLKGAYRLHMGCATRCAVPFSAHASDASVVVMGVGKR